MKKKTDLNNVQRGWQQALTMLPNAFHDFLDFYFPQYCAEIDWSAAPRRRYHKPAQDGLVDRVMEVSLRNAGGRRVLVHLLVQTERDDSLPLRIFGYNYGLFSAYGLPVASLVLLVDDDPGWRPSSFQSASWGTRLSFSFDIAKIQDYEEKAMRSLGLMA